MDNEEWQAMCRMISALEKRIEALEAERITGVEQFDDEELAALARKYRGKPVSLQHNVYVLALRRVHDEAPTNETPTDD